MSSIQIAGDTSGSITLSAPAVAGANTITLPAVTGTILTTAYTGDVTFGGTLTVTDDATINGLTVGKGANSVATNTALGVSALASGSLSGDANVSIGYQALYGNTTGAANVALGITALQNNTTASFNVAVGRLALSSLVGGTVTQNTAVGNTALYLTTTGINNCGVGAGALLNNTTGANNTALGMSAGSTLTTGSNNTLLGYDAEPSSATVSNEVTIGNASVTTLRMGNGNLLPTDYEEGTFAPVLTDGTNAVSTYYYQNARYTKIGNLVNVRIIISVNNKGSISGAMYINNLPFTNMDNSNPTMNSFPIRSFNGNTRDYDTARLRTSDKIELFYILGQTEPTINGTSIGAGSQFGLNFHYFTTE